MQELHVKSLLPVRLDKYLMEQFPALGLGRLNQALRETKLSCTAKSRPLPLVCRTAMGSAFTCWTTSLD